MSIRRWIRDFLGITADMEFLTRKLNYHSGEIEEAIITLQRSVEDLNRSVRVSHQGLGRLVAKMDPMFGRPEAQPDAVAPQSVKDDWARRKEESDKLGEAAINRLFAEDDARKRAEYPSGSQGTR